MAETDKKIIKVCYPFVGDSVGGSHKSALTLINGLDRTLVEPLIVLHCEGELANLLTAEGLDYTVLPLSDLPGGVPSVKAIATSIIRVSFSIRNFIKKHNIDLVHTNDLRCNLTWGLPSKLLAKHLWHQRTTLSNSLLWRFIGFLTNHVICISDTVRQTYCASAPSTTIFNPFVSHEFNRIHARELLAKEISVPHDSLIVGYVGRLSPNKGVETFSNLPAYLPNVVFVAAGGGELHRILPESIHYLGFRHPVESVLAALDVLVAPSIKEGFGRVLVESMLVGTPVVASNILAHREVTMNGKFAILFETNNPEIISSEISSLLFDPEKLKNLALSAQASARVRFGSKPHIEAVQSIYKRLFYSSEQ